MVRAGLTCAECQAPASEVDRFTLGGTAIADMRQVVCAAGHRYHEVVAFVDEPPMHRALCWAHSRNCTCRGWSHQACDATVMTDVGLCWSHHREIVGG